MLLQRKVDRAMKWSRERSLRAEGIDPEEEELKAELKKHSRKKDSAPSMEELIAEEKQKELERLEKGDVKATMILAAMITIFPICLGLILLICLIAYFFMAR
ncbi:MAG: hypothetical protein ACLTL5_01225 [Oscillospiraceae bacterium]